MKNITLIYTYYDCPDILVNQLLNWKLFPKRVADRVKIILIDDGSPNFPALEEVLNEGIDIDITIYRIEEDIFQNVYGARNLGYNKCDSGWVWNLDIDHIVLSQDLDTLLSSELDPNNYYLSARQTTMYEPISRHSDNFIMTKELFWKTGGYDERLTGYYYNGAGYAFRKILNKLSKKQYLDDVWITYVNPDEIEDASPIKKKIPCVSLHKIKVNTGPILQFEYITLKP